MDGFAKSKPAQPNIHAGEPSCLTITPGEDHMFAETRSHTHTAIAENGVLVAYLVFSMKIHREIGFDHEIWGVNPAKFSSPNHDSSPKMALMSEKRPG